MKYSLLSPIFLKRSLVFPTLLFSSTSLHCSFKKAFLSLLAVLWNSGFSWVYLSLYLLLFTSILSSTICKASSDNHSAFLHFFFFEMVLVTASCTMLWTFVHSPSGFCLPHLIPWIYLSLSLYNHKRFDLGHTWSSGFPCFLQFKSEFGNKEFMVWATFSSTAGKQSSVMGDAV